MSDLTDHMIVKMATIPVNNISLSENERYRKLGDSFKEKYEREAEFFCRAPGRVNLIGEHIDYCGYAVLPMAITQDIVIAAATNDSSQLTLANQSDRYKDHSRMVDDLSIDSSSVQWYNYFICGYRGILEHEGLTSSKGLQMMMHGCVPPSAGLSSSSAFVCCAALTTMYANGKNLPKLELADICQHCERYIGTEGGGMDQACSLLAQAGTAKLIEFNPLRCTDVSLPEGATFVISNSCVEMNKAATSHFNIRVVECRLAAQVLAKACGLEWREVRKLGDLQQRLASSLDDMVTMVQEKLHKHSYSKQEVCQILGVTEDELNSTSLSANTLQVEQFELYKRGSHVYQEARRVLLFKKVCEEKPAEALVQLGQLMSDSHASCRDLYECSHPQLDKLVDICMSSGALGSRLTGAGWGGCAVSLVSEQKLQGFLSAVAREFYNDDLSNLSDRLFATKPGAGAAIYLPA